MTNGKIVSIKTYKVASRQGLIRAAGISGMKPRINGILGMKAKNAPMVPQKFLNNFNLLIYK